jgi:ketosteroid isomerase-like protein
MDSPEVDVVTAWHDALNAGDLDRLTALSAEDIEVGGPRGSGKGAPLLREWVERAGIRLVMGRVYRRGTTVVVEERGEWRASGAGQAPSRQVVATIFQVRDGRVAAAVRYPGLADTLTAAGLSEADRIPSA